MQFDAVGAEPRRHGSDHRCHEVLRSVADQQGGGDPLAIEHEAGVLSDVVRGVLSRSRPVGGTGRLTAGVLNSGVLKENDLDGWFLQVIPEGDDDPVLLAETEHDQAAARVEPEQVRHNRKHGVRRRGSQLNPGGDPGWARGRPGAE